MAHFVKNKITALVLCAGLIIGALSSCSKPIPVETDDTNYSLNEPAGSDAAQDVSPKPIWNEGYAAADNVFSVIYDSKASLNPLYSTNIYNSNLFSLVYEGLFCVGEDFTAEPVLCSDYHTADGITYIFNIKTGVKFHDGTTLTAQDVVYTVNMAVGSSKYSSRFSSVIAINAIGSYTVEVVLSSPNYDFPILLDIPIIKDGAMFDTAPAGTGPYYAKYGYSLNRLSAFENHRDRDKLPLDVIYLRDVNREDPAEAFSCRNADILSFDPTGLSKLNIHLEYETRYYDTSDLIYLGFNENASSVCSYPEIRRAVSCLVDRESICGDIFKKAVTPAPLILSPAAQYYDETWEEGLNFSKKVFSSTVLSMGMSDKNSNGFLEHPEFGPFTLRVVVNSESSYKLRTAEKLVSALKSSGFSAELNVLPFSEFLTALTQGEFDIYLGELLLTPDFNFSQLLTSDGSLNYGKISDARYSELISDFLAAENAAEKQSAAKALCLYAAEDASVVPIAYKKHAVLTHIGVVSEAALSVSGMFCHIKDWKVDLE